MPGASRTVLCKTGLNPLTTALIRTDVLEEVCKLLIQIDPVLMNQPDARGSIPFHTALFNRQNMIPWMIEHGADVHRASRYEVNFLHSATTIGAIEMVKLAVEKGANLQARTGSTWAGDHMTALDLAIACHNEEIRDYLEGVALAQSEKSQLQEALGSPPDHKVNNESTPCDSDSARLEEPNAPKRFRVL